MGINTIVFSNTLAIIKHKTTMNKAEKWAKSYFERLEKTLSKLNNHLLIEHVNFTSFKGLSEEQILALEKDVKNLLQENAKEKEIDGTIDFKFDDYFKEFYKISNGLNLSWDTHIYESSLKESKILNNSESLEDFVVANSALLQAEGFLSLLPLNNLLSYTELNICGDPQDSKLGQDLTNQGGHFTYLDHYHFYYDTCINISGNSDTLLFSGENNSARYNSDKVSDFVIYMEHNLATYFSVFLRYKSFYKSETIKSIQDKSYLGLVEKVALENEYNSLDKIIKYHSIDEELIDKYAAIDYLESKPKEIYQKIEDVLDIIIEDEVF